MPPPLSPEVLAKREQVLRANYARGDLKALAAELVEVREVAHD